MIRLSFRRIIGVWATGAQVRSPPSADREQVEPRFVSPQDGPAFGYGLFFSSGKR